MHPNGYRNLDQNISSTSNYCFSSFIFVTLLWASEYSLLFSKVYLSKFAERAGTFMTILEVFCPQFFKRAFLIRKKVIVIPTAHQFINNDQFLIFFTHHSGNRFWNVLQFFEYNIFPPAATTNVILLIVSTPYLMAVHQTLCFHLQFKWGNKNQFWWLQ